MRNVGYMARFNITMTPEDKIWLSQVARKMNTSQAQRISLIGQLLPRHLILMLAMQLHSTKL